MTKPDVRNQCYIYACTIWAEIDRQPDVDKFCRTYCKKWIYQLEQCPTTGTKHFQCLFNLTDKRRDYEMRKLLNDNCFKGAKADPASNQGKEQLKSYCMKTDSRVAGPWASTNIYLGKDLICQLRPWQQEIVNMINTQPDPRKIYWYYDEKGGKGKSSLAKYMYFHHKVLTLSIGKASDLLNLVFKMQGRKMYVFDISRTVPRAMMTEIYMALESIKNGYFVNTKYDTGVCIMETPHIVVFSNMRPKEEALSKDRWIIKVMDEEKSEPNEPRKIYPLDPPLGIDSASAGPEVSPSPTTVMECENFVFENLSI